MTDAPVTLTRAILAAAARGLAAPDAESGMAQLSASEQIVADPSEWANAVAAAVRDRLIHDPVRLPPGALQCHWRLELSDAGRARLERDPPPPN